MDREEFRPLPRLGEERLAPPSTARPTGPCCATTATGSRGSAWNVERADNTARILDVKYHVLLPETEQVGGSLDYFQWTTMLREVSALTAYHWVYRQAVKPTLIADLLILNRRMPRSLASCYENISRFLDAIGDAYNRHGPAQRQARKTSTNLANTPIEAVLQRGLHEFIEDFITENNRLGNVIVEQYLQ